MKMLFTLCLGGGALYSFRSLKAPARVGGNHKVWSKQEPWLARLSQGQASEKVDMDFWDFGKI